MSDKNIMDELVGMLKITKEIKEHCKTNNKLRILFDSELKYSMNELIRTYNNEFKYINDVNECKIKCRQLLIEIGVPEVELN